MRHRPSLGTVLETEGDRLPPRQRQQFALTATAAKGKMTMSKVAIHFIGVLANVDDSISKLRLGVGFTIEGKSEGEVAPVLRMIDQYYGLQARLAISHERYYCVARRNIAQFDATPQGGVVIRPQISDKNHVVVRDKLRLLRLFKEGNVFLAYSLLYHIKDTEPTPLGSIREYPLADQTPFTLMSAEVSEARSFMETVSLALPQEPLRLAFESFELSYAPYDVGLAFLSLMTAMEVLLNPSDRELRYRVSRNAGVLLGQDRSDGEAIFTGMRSLYDKRSKLVHTGDRSVVTREDMLELRRYVREAIKEVVRCGIPKDQLTKMLNSCGFGERPSRQSAP